MLVRITRSITVFRVKTDKVLCQKCSNELFGVYSGENRSRPKHLSKYRKKVTSRYNIFSEHTHNPNWRVSIRKTAYKNKKQLLVDISIPYCVIGEQWRNEKQIELTDVQNTLETMKSWFIDIYECLRCVASEILVFV